MVNDGDTVVVNPSKYPWGNLLGRDQDCRFLLQSPTYKKLELKFTEFFLRNENHAVFVYDGADTYRQILAK